MSLQIDHKTIKDRVIDELRGLLLAGHFKPGQKLDEKELANNLGVSRMPIRQALQKLTSEGLVETQPFRGATVVNLAPEDIRDIYDIRIQLEGLAAGLAAQVSTPERCAYLERLLSDMEASIETHDYAYFHSQNNAFHFAMYEVGKRKRLYQIIRDLRAQSALLMTTYLRLPDVASLAVKEHKSILEACRRQDAESAERLMRNHLERSASTLINLRTERVEQ